MKIGDQVRMKSATIQFGTPVARGSVVLKAVAGRELMFLYLGSCDAKNPADFDARAVLRAMGWIPNPDLQAEFDEDAAAKEQPA